MKNLPTQTCRPLLLASGIALALGAASAAAQGRIDRSFDAAPETKSCADVRWSRSVLDKYPSISDSCQNIEWRDGKSYAKLEGTVEEVMNDGAKLRVDFDDGGELTLAPSPGMTLYVEGEKTSFADLREGQELNFYIPEDRFQAEFPGAGASVSHVIVPILTLSPATTASSSTSAASGASAPSGMSASSNVSADRVGTLVLIPVAQQTVVDEARSDGCWATLYGENNFNGDSLTLIGPLEMKRMVGPFGFDWDDKVNSIKAGPHATVTLYDNESYADKSARIEPGKSVPEISERMGLFEEVESMKLRCDKQQRLSDNE